MMHIFSFLRHCLKNKKISKIWKILMRHLVPSHILSAVSSWWNQAERSFKSLFSPPTKIRNTDHADHVPTTRWLIPESTDVNEVDLAPVFLQVSKVFLLNLCSLCRASLQDPNLLHGIDLEKKRTFSTIVIAIWKKYSSTQIAPWVMQLCCHLVDDLSALISPLFVNNTTMYFIVQANFARI